MIRYELADGRFTDIQVADNGFPCIAADGRSQELGVPRCGPARAEATSRHPAFCGMAQTDASHRRW